MKVVYNIDNLNCAHCAAKIEAKLNKNEKIKKATLNFVKKEITITSDYDVTEIVKKTVSDIEPEAKIVTEITEENKKPDFIRVSIGTILFIIGMFIKSDLKIAFFIAAYVLIGIKVIISAIKCMRHLNALDENVLMFIASLGAFIIKEYPEAVAVMLFFNIGEYFQAKAVAKTRNEISNLMNIKPEHANLVLGTEEKKVSPEALKIGDIIKIKPGEKIPVDSEIIEGASEIDTKALTGEALPSYVKKGDILLSGSININKVLLAKVVRNYDQSAVAKILNLIENSSESKSKTENFISHFAKYYTPSVVISAILVCIIPPFFTGFDTFSSWLYKGLMFLVVSCPCALVLSVPLGYFAGIGSASKSGILIKGTSFLDTLTNIKTVVFDKTGTLTEGNLKIKEVKPNNITKEELTELAAIGEYSSNHPIAKAILSEYKGSIVKEDITNYEEIPGMGVKLLYKDKPLVVGNSKLCPDKVQSEIGTSVYIYYDNIYKGYIELQDTIKQDSYKAVKALKSMGIKTAMITGDKEKSALYTSNLLDIDKCYYELLPHEKAKIIKDLCDKENGNVAFAGDGINDAPSLKISDVGFSMGGVGQDAAIEASDIVLMKDNPSLIATSIKIAYKTRKIVTENIAFALIVKFAVLILALFSLTNMWAAVFADVGVSLIAVLNSLRALKK